MRWIDCRMVLHDVGLTCEVQGRGGQSQGENFQSLGQKIQSMLLIIQSLGL